MRTTPGAIDYRRIIRNTPPSGVLTAINGGGPVPYTEGWWQATLDATNVWNTTVSGTSTVTAPDVTARRTVRCASAAATEQASIWGRRILTSPTLASATTDIWQRLIMKFEAAINATVANQDNDRFVMGLGASGAAVQATNNDTVGFILVADALNFTTRRASSVNTVVPSPPTLTNFNRYRIEIDATSIRGYVNGTLVATHTTGLPIVPLIPGFTSFTDAGGAGSLNVGVVRVWYEDQ